MKNNELQKGIKDIKDTRLSSDEKVFLFASLNSYAQNNKPKIAQKVNIWSGFVIHSKYSYVTAILLLCVLVGGTVTYAAERSLPGDVLYPVKIYVNESVKSATKVTPQSRVKFEEEKILKRFTEVESLIEKGKFNHKERIQVEKQFEKSVKAINLNKKTNATTTHDEFKKELYTRIKKIKKGNAELKLNIEKEKDNQDEVEKFQRKIQTELGELDFDPNEGNRGNNKNIDKK